MDVLSSFHDAALNLEPAAGKQRAFSSPVWSFDATCRMFLSLWRTDGSIIKITLQTQPAEGCVKPTLCLFTSFMVVFFPNTLCATKRII